MTNAGLTRAGGQQMVPTEASAQRPAALPRSLGSQPGHAGGSLSTPANSSTDLEAEVATATRVWISQGRSRPAGVACQPRVRDSRGWVCGRGRGAHPSPGTAEDASAWATQEGPEPCTASAHVPPRVPLCHKGKRTMWVLGSLLLSACVGGGVTRRCDPPGPEGGLTRPIF